MSDPGEIFERECRGNVARMAASADVRRASIEWIHKTTPFKYSYNFRWLGRPIIQFPQDMFALQELTWSIKPRLIVETGIAHGGSLIFHASMLELLGGDGIAVGVDVEIRPHNRVAIEGHPLYRRCRMIEGSSIAPEVVKAVQHLARDRAPVLVVLDSNHTHEHVLSELRLYSPLVSKGSYLVVLDTVIEDMPEGFYPDRPWGPGDNPKTAVRQFLRENTRFEVDHELESKLQITVAPEGFLRCVRD